MATGPAATETGGPSRIIRFAVFEFDSGTGELRKHGLRIKVQGQPINVLAMLVERAGEVVTREELQKRLWPADVYVDFEHSLNAAMKRLRAALGDSSDAPRFIETLPRQGYRFIAPLTRGVTVDAAPVQPPESPAISPAPEFPHASQKTAPWWHPIILAAAGVATAIAAFLWVPKPEYFWRNPIADARFQIVTDSDGMEQAAAISRDGQFVAFLSDRDGQMDVWVTQVGSGQFHNLTRGSARDIVNPELRSPGFSPDGSLVTFWDRKQPDSAGRGIGVWAVPTLGGQPRPYLEGVAEFDWSPDGSRLVYHTPAPGDPMFVSDGNRRPSDRPIFTAPPGLHCHFQLWSADAAFVYFVRGSFPAKLDIWRIRPSGGTPERVTSHNSRVTHPVLLDRRTLIYLAGDPDGSGPWLYSTDVERGIPHRLTSGLDRYTSLAATADGRRLVATRSSSYRTLWRLPLSDSPPDVSTPVRVSLTTGTGFSPRLNASYLLYVSANGATNSLWKLVNGAATELWSAPGTRVIGSPAISADGRRIAFSVQHGEQTLLYVMQSDGTNSRIVADSLKLQGDPAWSLDGQSITAATDDHGTVRLFRVPLDGRSPTRFVQEYSIDPAWSPDGRFVVYSGPDIGTVFSVKAVTSQAAAYPLPALTLTRGARRLVFLSGGHALVFLQGEMHHKNLWRIDLETGARRQLTNLAPDFDVSDFDVSQDSREVILERQQERSDVVLIDRPGR